MSKLAKYTMALLSMSLFFSCIVDEDDKISVSPNEVTIEQAGGTFSVEVTSTSDYTVTIPEDSKWISLAEGSTTTFNVSAAAGARTGKVIFSNAISTDSVIVSQKGKVSEEASEFMKKDVPGFYINGSEAFVYSDYTSQYSVQTNTKSNTRYFKIMENTNPKFMIVSRLPVTVKTSQYYNIQIQQNFSTTLQKQFQGSFFVENISDGKVWLYNYDQNYGIILLTNE